MVMRRTCFLILIILSTVVGCQDKLDESVTTEAEIRTRLVSSQISLGNVSPEFFAYNMASNSLTIISRSENLYKIYRLDGNKNIQDPDIHWRIPKDYSLDNFAHSPDGSLYAVLKHYDKKGKTRQSIVLLQNNGSYRNISLKGLNDIPNTKMDSYIKKKDKKSDRSITDMRFYGTALAVTYSNYAVKFYNISEGMPLGDTGITGAPGRNIFYEHYFITTGLTYGHEDILHYYDIRNGEKLNSVRLEKLLCVSNYRGKIYLLTEDNILSGSIDSNEFQTTVSIRGLDLPSRTDIELFATREDGLYLVCRDILYWIDLS